MTACCGLGKKLASLETATEVKCLAEYVQKSNAKTQMFENQFIEVFVRGKNCGAQIKNHANR